jgi:hypothetical protein
MEKNGFDNFKPIDVWQGIVIDGNSRFKAAIMAGIKEVAVYEHNFRNQEEALEYAIHNQRDRRNITDAEIYKHVWKSWILEEAEVVIEKVKISKVQVNF